MAIQVNWDSERYGTNSPSAYCKITSFSGDLDTLTINVSIWNTQADKDTGAREVDDTYVIATIPDSFTISSGGLIAWAYNKVKADERFSGAIDV